MGIAEAHFQCAQEPMTSGVADATLGIVGNLIGVPAEVTLVFGAVLAPFGRFFSFHLCGETFAEPAPELLEVPRAAPVHTEFPGGVQCVEREGVDEIADGCSFDVVGDLDRFLATCDDGDGLVHGVQSVDYFRGAGRFRGLPRFLDKIG